MRKRIITFAVVSMLTTGVPAASATPVEKATQTVESAAKSVTAPANTGSSLPRPAPPAKTPASAAGRVPARPPSEPPARAPASVGPDSEAPSGEGVTHAASDSVGSGSRVMRSAGEAAAPSAPGDDPTSLPQSRPSAGASSARVRATRAASSSPPSIKPAEVAALQHWIASIGPAIALEGGESARGWIAALIDGGLEGVFRPALAAVAPLQSLVSPDSRPVVDSPPGAGVPATSTGSQPAAPIAPPSASGPELIYLLAIAALLGLLAFTVWRELRHAIHPHLR